VPTDQPGHLIAEEAPPKESPIENELPTYRAISSRAVLGLLCGALASFSFASSNFLVFAVLAIVLGILANRAIRRSPDVLTGARLANAGIAMGLIFGLTVLTYTFLHNFIIRREATRFAQEYAKVFEEGSLGDLLLYREPPLRRKDQAAADREKELEKMNPRDRMMFETRMGPMLELRKAVSAKGTQMHFVRIEGEGVDDSMAGGVFYFAAALYEVEGAPAGAKGEGDAHRYALALFKGLAKGRHYEWWVDDVRFPYQPKSFQMQPKPVDDGHGHAGGH
jgi:hypothetical protein